MAPIANRRTQYHNHQQASPGLSETTVLILNENFLFLKVVQRRQDGSVDFYRTFEEYAVCFGETSGEFWIGE